PLHPVGGVARPTAPVPALRRLPAPCVMEPPVVFAPVFVATVIVTPDPVDMSCSTAPPAPPVAAFTLIRTAVAVAFVVVIELPGLIVKLSAPAPLVLALTVTRLLPAPPTLAFSVTASPLVSVIAPLPVDVGPATVSVPVALVRLIAPAPVAVAGKAAPSVSVTKAPPEPVAAVMVPAEVSTLAPGEPIRAVAAPVRRVTVSFPVSRSVAAVWVMDPPVALPPVFVATLIVPP